MLGINVFSFLAFAAINLCAVAITKYNESKRNSCMRLLCVSLLAVTLCRFAPVSILLTGDVILPVEFSSIASFSVPIILLVGFEKGRIWAAYSGLMAGFFYYVTMIIAGGTIYESYEPYQIYLSLFSHGIVYLCGLVLLKTQKFDLPEFYKPLAGVGCVLLNARLLRPFADSGMRIFIYEIMEGRHVRDLFPGVNIAPVYYVILTGLLVLTVVLFFKLNKTQYERWIRATALTGSYAVRQSAGYAQERST